MTKEGNAWHPFREELMREVEDFQLMRAFKWTKKDIQEGFTEEERFRFLTLIKGMGSKGNKKKNG